MPRWRSHTSRAKARRIADAGKIVGVDEEKVVSERVRFDRSFICGRTRAGASRTGARSDRGRALNVPTKKVLNIVPFQPLVQPRLHRKALFDDSDFAKAAQQRAELAGAVLAQHRRVLVLERDLHHLRQAVQPRDAVVDLEHGEPPGCSTRRHSSTSACRWPCTARRHARRRDRTSRRETAAARRRLRAGRPAAPAARNSAAPGRSQTTTGRRR